MSTIVEQNETQIPKQRQRQATSTDTVFDDYMVFESIDNDDDPIDCNLEGATSGVEGLDSFEEVFKMSAEVLTVDAIDEGPSDDAEDVFREPDSYDCRRGDICGIRGRTETSIPQSQPFSRTRQGQKKAAQVESSCYN